MKARKAGGTQSLAAYCRNPANRAVVEDTAAEMALGCVDRSMHGARFWLHRGDLAMARRAAASARHWLGCAKRLIGRSRKGGAS